MDLRLLLAAAIALAALAPPAGAQGLTLVGVVVDVTGAPLEGVVVEAYRGDAYVASDRTMSNGYFSLALPGPGTYRLIFYKRGFERREMMVEIRGRGTLNLGQLTLRYAMEILVEAAYIVVDQGSRVELPVQVSNKGVFTEEVSIHVLAPPRWRAEVLDEEGLVLRRVVLAPGARGRYRLCMWVPRNETGLRAVALIFSYAGVRQELAVTVEVRARAWRLIELQYPHIVSFPGDVRRVPLRLRNSLGEGCVVKLLVKAPEGWAARLEVGGEQVCSVALEEGEVSELDLVIRVPEGAAPGTYEVLVRAQALDVVSEARLRVEVLRGYDEVVLEAGTPIVDATPGSTALIEVTVMNEGTKATLVTFSVSGLPPGYSWSLRDEGGNLVSAIRLPPRSSKRVVLAVEVPRGVEPTAVEFVLKAAGESSSDEAELGINVKGRPELRVGTRSWELEAFAGTPAKFVIMVENGGQVPLNDLAVQVDEDELPEGVSVEVEPHSVRVLPPGETVSFTLTISTSGKLPPGRYYIPLSIVGSGVRVDRSVALNVKTRSEYFFTAMSILIVATATAALAARYWRGRRG